MDVCHGLKSSKLQVGQITVKNCIYVLRKNPRITSSFMYGTQNQLLKWRSGDEWWDQATL
jgi:hypothetical protein